MQRRLAPGLSFISSTSRWVVTSVSCRTRSRSSRPRARSSSGLELLLEQRVLLQQGLVVLGEVLEERVHFLDVEAAEHLHRELLLADVHRRDAHGGLLSAASPEREEQDHPLDELDGEQMTISGERSSPPVFHGGSSRRTGRQHRLGDLAEDHARSGLRGSGLTHEISAAAMITQV